MNAPLRTPFGKLLKADFDFHGLRLDLYGTLGEDGYEVRHVLIPGSMISITECVSADLMAALGAALDGTLPTSEQLRKESRDEGRAERAVWQQDMAIFGRGGMS